MKHEAHRDVETLETPLALSASQLANQLGVSLRHIRRMDSAQMLPRPIRLGRSIRWPVEEVHNWLKNGAPDRRRWEQIKDRPERRPVR